VSSYTLAVQGDAFLSHSDLQRFNSTLNPVTWKLRWSP